MDDGDLKNNYIQVIGRYRQLLQMKVKASKPSKTRPAQKVPAVAQMGKIALEFEAIASYTKKIKAARERLRELRHPLQKGVLVNTSVVGVVLTKRSARKMS